MYWFLRKPGWAAFWAIHKLILTPCLLVTRQQKNRQQNCLFSNEKNGPIIFSLSFFPEKPSEIVIQRVGDGGQDDILASAGI
jgi:hypothetical protein